jgi:hypothetical protein
MNWGWELAAGTSDCSITQGHQRGAQKASSLQMSRRRVSSLRITACRFNSKLLFSTNIQSVSLLPPARASTALPIPRTGIYIGAANSLESVLLRHLNETETHMMRRNPTVFTWEKSLAEDRMTRKTALIKELKPLFSE